MVYGLMLLTTGCVRRSLTIRTDPPGASVYVNDQLKGESPITYDFLWYGGHRVMVRKEGFERIEDRKLLRAPVYLWIPFDLVMELLPVRIHDRRTWEYTLTPATTPPTPVPPVLAPSAQAEPLADVPVAEAAPQPGSPMRDDAR